MSDFPSISAETLQQALPAYPDLGEWRRIVRNGLSVNTPACLFETSTGQWFAKLEPLDQRSVETLRQEHVLVRHAAAKGYPVPSVLATREGDTFWLEGGDALVVSGLAVGEDRFRDVPVFAPFRLLEEVEEAGRCLARLHLAWSDLALPDPRPWSGMTAQCRLVEMTVAADVVDAWAEAHPVLVDRLQGDDRARFIRYLTPRLIILSQTSSRWPTGAIHGDFIKRNLFWQGERISAVIDFGLWNIGPWLLDLAFAMLPCGFDWPSLLAGGKGVRPTHLQAMLRAYNCLRPLTTAEAQALPVLMEVARLEFYLGIVAGHLMAGRVEDAERFWDLLNGVMAWFTQHPDWSAPLRQRAALNPV
jgi:Ser/Thr protein kinase RdoA (MazF antagonist)